MMKQLGLVAIAVSLLGAGEPLSTERKVHGVITSITAETMTIASERSSVTGRIDPARTNLDLPIVASKDPVLLKLVGSIRAAEPRLFARIQEVRRAGGDEILLTLSGFVGRDTLAPEGRTLRVRVPLGLSVERLADIFPVETDLARRQVQVSELDLRYRDQVIARLQ